MKTSKSLLAKRIAGFTFFMLLCKFSMASFKDDINQALNDYMVPVIVLLIVVGAIYGLVRNWDTVNDPHTRKEGLINIGVIILAAVLIVGAIAAVVAFTTGMKIKIQ